MWVLIYKVSWIARIFPFCVLVSIIPVQFYKKVWDPLAKKVLNGLFNFISSSGRDRR